jgi:hypothetical protein
MGKDWQDDRPLVPSYIAPHDDAAARERENDRKRAGMVLSAGAVLGTVFIWIISNLEIHPAPGRPTPVEYVGPALVALVAIVVIGGIGVWYWKREGSKAFLIGAVIGLGIGALIEGICFGILMSK